MADDTQTTDPRGQPASEAAERPEWLPEKFKTPEDFAKSYSELEKKLGSSKKEPVSIEREPPTEEVREIKDALNSAGVPFEEIVASVGRNGKPTEDQYQALEKEGYSRSVVDRIVRAEMAIHNTIASTVYETAGGEDQYKALQEWAASDDSGISDEYLDKFNEAVRGINATPESAKEQVEFLMFKYQQAGGNASKPSLISGGAAPGGKGGFNSYEEVRQASVDVSKGVMKVDEYNRRFAMTSPEYHKPPRRS